MHPQVFLLFLKVFPLFICFYDSFAYNYEKEVEKAVKMTFKIPQLSEEEIRSDHMPEHLRCDACKAVAIQISLSIKNRIQKRNSRLSESEVIELLENVCHNNFEQYGLRQVNGENRLAGPGLETENVMGITQMGGRWPHRLKELCYYYVGDAGEMEIYESFLKEPDALEIFFCYRKGIYGHCLPKISKMEF